KTVRITITSGVPTASGPRINGARNGINDKRTSSGMMTSTGGPRRPTTMTGRSPSNHDSRCPPSPAQNLTHGSTEL
ncbi:Unknown protein, partial [Striga hermonthica]